MARSLARKTVKKKGKGKGPSFERNISKEMSLWMSNGTRDDLVWRTSGSGGRATMRRKSGKKTANACGDLKAEHTLAMPFFEKCTVELKIGYKDYSIQDLLDKPIRGKKTLRTIEDFYLQATTDAKFAEIPIPIIIMKKDSRKALIVLPRDVFDAINEFFDEDMSYIYFSGNERMGESIIFELDYFFTSVPYKEFLVAVKPFTYKS